MVDRERVKEPTDAPVVRQFTRGAALKRTFNYVHLGLTFFVPVTSKFYSNGIILTVKSTTDIGVIALFVKTWCTIVLCRL